MSRPDLPTIHQHPLAYVLGLEGLALMRAFAGEHGADFVRERIARIRALVDDSNLVDLGLPMTLAPLSVADGYDGWAPSYDSPENAIFAREEAIVVPMLEALPPGFAVDAACGTGRGMLTLARGNVPGAAFARGDVHHLPLPDDSADLVVFSLAFAHVDEMAPVFAEFARVLRRGGRLVIADTRGQFTGSRLYPLPQQTLDGRWGYLPTWRHRTSDYLVAALPLGFEVLECLEPLLEPTPVDELWELEPAVPGEPPDIWNLMAADPAATVAAYAGAEALIVWHLQLG